VTNCLLILGKYNTNAGYITGRTFSSLLDTKSK
jgi:hypothetical protein